MAQCTRLTAGLAGGGSGGSIPSQLLVYHCYTYPKCK